eukprot:TRINITY_DN14323_c0_g1_i1.p1 TRINITY_DN14323_c0_g1~~TRINITY_DN14323_c0_g1_i1.p1  ORF type:complete len:111 (-),score=19.57 TRINITY_DN14323_c0_g1_i1:169-501(-)
MLRSLVGSEMCIRDRYSSLLLVVKTKKELLGVGHDITGCDLLENTILLVVFEIKTEDDSPRDGQLLLQHGGDTLLKVQTVGVAMVGDEKLDKTLGPVSYTHLTLPTKRIV